MKTNSTELSYLARKERVTKPRRDHLVLLALATFNLGIISVSAETTVEVVHYFNVEGQLQELAQIQKDFEQANSDIKIKYTYVPFGELVSRTLQMAAVHKAPAIAVIDNPDVLRVAKSNILKDISQEVTKLPIWNDLYPGPKKAVTSDGKAYGVPVGSNSLALYYNKKMLSAAGVQPPNTWQQLSDVATKTAQSPVYGIAFSAVNTEESTWQWEPFLWSNGGSLRDLTSTSAVGALQLWVDLVSKGLASKDVLNWEQGDVANQFTAGRAATMVMGPWMLDAVKKSGIDFGIVPVPVPKEGAKPVVPLGGECWCVLKGNSQVEAAAMKFVAFTEQPDRLRKICDAFNYISSVQSVAKQQGESNPELNPFVEQMDAAKARSEDGGAKYPEISLATRAAIQRAISGQGSAEEALQESAAKIKAILSKN
jgi:multiple sugar transport system substrate-binding protein